MYNSLKKFKKYLINTAFYKRTRSILFMIFLKLSLRQRFNERQLEKIKNFDCWVVSPGGVGTTALIGFLKEHILLNHQHDEDGLKHSICPPKNLNKKLKVIFVTGKEKEVINSLKRRFQPDGRSYFEHHFEKFESLAYLLNHNFKSEKRFIKLMQKQKQNWENNVEKENFLITNYDVLFESGERIINFLNLKKNIAKDFPKRSNRTTKTLKQNES